MPKMIWLEEWLFMYSGEPSNVDLFLDEIRPLKGELTRASIRPTVHKAFRKRVSRWASDGILAPFDMDMDEFKREGRSIFGDVYAAEIARQISEVGKGFYDQLLLVGWGGSENAVLLHEETEMGQCHIRYRDSPLLGLVGQPQRHNCWY
jgi:hypothetical protein